VPVSGTASSLTGYVTSAVPSGGSVVFTLRNSTTATDGPTCTVAAGQTKCGASSGTVAFSAGDSLVVRVVIDNNNNDYNNVQYRWVAKFVP
jgi:hypothetical protein